MLGKILNLYQHHKKRRRSKALAGAPTIIPRPEHTLSRSHVSENALRVLYRLKNAGYQAHLVGGGVRDLLLGLEPKDFDIATDARPEQVRRLFNNCRLIGRRFRLAHILFGREIIEVATFRASHDPDEDTHNDGRILRDNVYGSIEEDAVRRDFTINALYYNIADFSIVDYVGGLTDLKQRTLRMIGNPEQRYREDPVRMLRAVRFSAKLGLTIEQDTAACIKELAILLRGIPPARLFEETQKLFLKGAALTTYRSLQDYQLFEQLFPELQKLLEQDSTDRTQALFERLMQDTDARVAADKPVTVSFLLAALLWPAVDHHVAWLEDKEFSPNEALHKAISHVLGQQNKHVAITRRFMMSVRDIWLLQPQFHKRNQEYSEELLEHPRFRAAYDLLVLRAAHYEPELNELANWWTTYQTVKPAQRAQWIQDVHVTASEPPKKRRRPRRRKPKAAG